MNPIYKTYTKNEANRLRATTKGGAIEKSAILLSQYWKNSQFELTDPICHFKLFLKDLSSILLT